ncbi:MAG: DNA excision repair protein ERCC-2 [Halioglobus sp.]|jgi:DNA excision repair protein ERCC-2
MPELTVSVRDLAVFVHRTGDIDFRFKPSPTGVQGTQGHQKLFRARPASYASEYPVQYQADEHFLLRGRADGYDAAGGYVEEIKTCRVHPDTIPESITRVHMSQARLYGAMIAIAEDLPALEVRLTWFNIDTELEISLEQVYSRGELEAFLAETIEKFSNWRDAVLRKRTERDLSLKALEFPYREFRDGQRDIAELVYKCIDQNGQLVVEAPTGIGKTAAVLFPALKALATDKHDRVAFLTAKSVGRNTAQDTLKIFSEAGYRGNAISLSAKDKVCLSPGKACHGQECPYALGYYDKLSAAMLAAIELPLLRREELDELARRFEVCPYQLSLDLLPWIDVVIGDLHHLYGLTGMLSGLVQSDGHRWTALLDEAHNLPSRARGMFSVHLAKSDLLAAKAVSPKSLTTSLNRINGILLGLQKESWQEPAFDSRSDLPSDLLDCLNRFVGDCSEAQAEDASALHRAPVLLEFYFSVLQFLRIAETWGDDFRFEMAKDSGKQSLGLTLNCLNPARLLAKKQEILHSLTAFSATLSPASWMQSSLGVRPESVYRRLQSPFASAQMSVSVATHIDTSYRQRANSLGDLASALVRWFLEVPGNCIVYFPSYQYMRDALGKLAEITSWQSGRTHWVQEREQGDSGRAELFEKLQSRQDIVAFCILGGVFGEGIDLPGDQLSSVVVVGVGLPAVNRDTEQLRDYFEGHYGSGFEYAYLYPGMQKVDQALGRVIRQMDDRGSALIIDHRYRLAQYRNLLPPWWEYSNYDRASMPM